MAHCYQSSNLASILFDGNAFSLRFRVLFLKSLVALAIYQSSRVASLHLFLMDACRRLHSYAFDLSIGYMAYVVSPFFAVYGVESLILWFDSKAWGEYLIIQ